VLRQLGGSELGVGIALACSGVAGLLSATVAGRIDSRGRELRLMVLPMATTAPVLALLVLPAGGIVSLPPLAGFLTVCLVMLALGLLDGPLDIGLFTLRQRRTPTAWIGRAFAISMSVNALGYPVGSAAAGVISESSLTVAIGLAAVTCLVAAGLVARLVPRDDPDAEDLKAYAPTDSTGEAALL
jgi:predicted MFS family arabinose efflux permease